MPNETKKCLLCQAATAAADDNKNRQLTRVARYIVVTVVAAAVVTDNLMWHIKPQQQLRQRTVGIHIEWVNASPSKKEKERRHARQWESQERGAEGQSEEVAELEAAAAEAENGQQRRPQI